MSSSKITQYRIKFFSNFCENSLCKINYENLCDAIGPLCNHIYGSNKSIYFVDENDKNYNHIIILNTAIPTDKELADIPKHCIIGLAFEPFEFLGLTPSFIDWAASHIGRYYIGEKKGIILNHPTFFESFSYMWYSRPVHLTRKIMNPIMNPIKNPKNIMSIVFSKKNWTINHQYRYKLVKEILSQKLPIDIYGIGCDLIPSQTKSLYSNIKGSFSDAEPYETYYFTIAIENHCEPHYFSEKIMSPLLYECKPIYLGCKNIHSYFNPNDVLLLKPIGPDISDKMQNYQSNLSFIKQVLFNPKRFYENTMNTKENEQKINIIHNIHHLFTF